MSKKNKHRQQQAAQPAQQPAPPTQAPGAQPLPAPLRLLQADYSQVLRMRNVRWLIVIAAIVGALLLGAHLSTVFIPLLVALALAYILNPVVVRLQRRGMSRTRAVLFVFLLLLVTGAAAGTWVIASVVRDVRDMSEQAAGLLNDFKENQDEWIESWNENVPEKLRLDPREDLPGRVTETVVAKLFPASSEEEAPEQASARAQMTSARAALLSAFQRADRNANLTLEKDEIDTTEFTLIDRDKDSRVTTAEWFVHFGATPAARNGATLSTDARQVGGDVLGYAGSGLTGLFTLLLWLTLIPIYTWYFMVGYDRVVAGAREYLPGRHRPRMERIAREIDGMLKAFFRGRIIVVLIIGTLTTIMYLAFGVKYAVLLGLMAGLGVLIPYFSMVVSWIPAMIIMGVSGDGVGAIVGMSVCFHAIQAFEQYILTPKLLGDAVELHPVTLLVGVFVMASLFGLFGALLAVPLTAIAKTLGREFLLPYFKSFAAEKPAE